MSSASSFTPLDSSHIEGYSYDAETWTLHVRFKGGNTYAYQSVPPDKADNFASASSPGQFLHAYIKPHHEYSKV
jgi:hypothetical protein